MGLLFMQLGTTWGSKIIPNGVQNPFQSILDAVWDVFEAPIGAPKEGVNSGEPIIADTSKSLIFHEKITIITTSRGVL